jgi:hypothetical protein
MNIAIINVQDKLINFNEFLRLLFKDNFNIIFSSNIKRIILTIELIVVPYAIAISPYCSSKGNITAKLTPNTQNRLIKQLSMIFQLLRRNAKYIHFQQEQA